MESIFTKIAEIVAQKKTTQTEVAKKLAVNQGNISAILRKKAKPSKPLLRLAEIIYGDLRKPHPEPIIEKTILMMEAMDKNTQKSALDCIQKEKLLEELKRERNFYQERKAA